MHRDEFSQYHPLTNFLFFLGAIGFGVIIQHPAYITAGCVSSAIYHLLLTGHRGRLLILGMIPVFLLVTFINPVFNHHGETVLFYFFGNPYTLEATVYGMIAGGILVVTILWFSCYSKVLTSDKFVSLFGSLAPALSLLLVMVLRMIPNLMRKATQIIGARKSIGKGAGEQSGNKEKIIDGMNILSALTDWALEGSIITADSMRSRGYGAAKRTSFQIYRITLRDIVMILVMGVLLVSVLFFGNTAAEFSPVILIPPLTPGFGSYCLFLMIPILLHVKEAVKWHISLSKI